MAKTLQFVYTMILFTSLFFLAKNINGKLFFKLFRLPYLVCCSYTIFYLIILTLLYSLFFIIGYIECNSDDDCPKLESRMVVLKCTNNRCAAVLLH